MVLLDRPHRSPMGQECLNIFRSEAEAARQTHEGNLATLNEPVNRGRGDFEQGRQFADVNEFRESAVVGGVGRHIQLLRSNCPGKRLVARGAIWPLVGNCTLTL